MRILVSNPIAYGIALPSKGFPCLYLFGDARLCKVGKTTDLAQRSKTYARNGWPCLAFVGPFTDLRIAENDLVRHFRTLFRPFSGNERFETDKDSALRAFVLFYAPILASGE